MVTYLRRLFIHPSSTLLRLSTLKMSDQVCCTSGNPTSDGAKGKGSLAQLGDSTMVYTTSAGYGRGILLIYDIFGFDIGQTRQFADELAVATRATVVMPDFFHGQAWPLAQFPPPDKDKFQEWLGSIANVDSTVSVALKSALPHLRVLLDKPESPVSLLGFCWGGKVVVKSLSSSDCPFACGVAVHPAFLSNEDIDAVQRPLALLPAANDPDMLPFMKILEKKSFGSKCIHKRYEGVEHGFCAARGDRNNPEELAKIRDAMNTAARFVEDNA